MNFTCPPPESGLAPEAKPYAIVISVLYPLYIIVGVALFIYYRKSSVFLRRRPLSFILITTTGALLGWSAITLRMLAGNEAYPCWLMGLLYYSAAPLVKATLVLKDARYLTEVAAIRMGREMARNRAHSVRQSSASGVNFDDEGLDLVGHDASLETFRAHMRTIFRCRRKETDRVNNVKFTRSPFFAVFWVSMIFLPFFIAFIVRVSEETAWNQGCYGCDIGWTDASILLSIFVVGVTFGNFVHCKKVSDRDALRITRETQVCWRAGLFTIPAMVLYMTDPGQIYANGYFNWLEIVQLTPFFIVYLQTYRQVYKARVSYRHRLLTSKDINREERYQDVQSDKELRQAFRNHLDSELSPEIYLFLDAVDKYRANYEKYRDTGRFNHAEKLIGKFVDRRCPLEVNLSSKVRDRLFKSFAGCSDTKPPIHTIFDEAYAEVKEHLLNDGFVRFLDKVGPMFKMKSPSNRSVNTPRSAASSPSHRSSPKTPMSFFGNNSSRSLRMPQEASNSQRMVHFNFDEETGTESSRGGDQASVAPSEN